MNLTYVPLLQQERALYRLPRDYNRFRTYLDMTIDWETERVRLPLLGMNPMAREHVGEFLDALLAIDADGVGERATAEAASQVADVPGSYRVALVVCDDLRGGWTNRFSCEYAQCLCAPLPPGQAYLDWLIGVLWVSEPPTAETVRESVVMSICRQAYVHQHGSARTLRELMAQEGQVMAQAGCNQPTLDAEDLEYTRSVIEPFLDATDMRTAIECLYGDVAGRTLGFTPRGLSDRAGLALALHDARATTAESFHREPQATVS
jgi:hypothetical protein